MQLAPRKLIYLALRVLAAMQYTDKFHPIVTDYVKQGMAIDGQASGARLEFGALNADQWLFSKGPKVVF